MMFIGRLKIAAARVVAAAVLVVAFVEAGSVIAAMRQTAPARARLEVGKAADAAPARVGPWIRGLVVDTSGRPVGGARVTSLWTLESPVVNSKADGTFAIPNDEPRLANLSFLATADGGARQGIFRFDDLATGPKDPRTLARIVLKPACVVTVTVVDGHGALVEGAAVSVLDVIFPVALGRTDTTGKVSLRAPVDALTQWIFGYKSGVGLDYFENYRSVPASFSPPPESARLVLNGARIVRVRAQDSTGKPVPGVDFVPWTLQKRGKLDSVNLCGSAARVRTDEQGVAEFDWFPSRRSTRRELRSGDDVVLHAEVAHARGRKARSRADGHGPAVHAGLGEGDAAGWLAGRGHPGRRRWRRPRVSSRLEPSATRVPTVLTRWRFRRTSRTRST